MPRPRISPSQRRRVEKACNYCRISRKKCSGNAPCDHCTRRGKEDSCSLPRRSSVPAPVQVSVAPNGVGTFTNILAISDFSNGQNAPISPPLESRSEVASELATGQCGTTPQSQQRRRSNDSSNTSGPQPRMLLDSRGERVFLGRAASISFLQLIRNIVAETVGPSRFTHNDSSDRMLETQSMETSPNLAVDMVLDIPAEQKLLYSDIFYRATEGVIDIFSSSEVEALLSGSSNADSLRINPYKLATINLIVAIGAQCQSLISAEEHGKRFFSQAQRYAFNGMLEDPSVDMVRAFLLMSFYMLGECRRNAAFMYLGIATRAAVALGLHCRDSYAEMTDLRYQIRLRIWLSLCNLDLLVSTILGRPSATAALRSYLSHTLDSISTQGDQRTAYALAAYRILEVSSKVVDKLYEKKEASVTAIVELLNEMKAWSQALPETLRDAFGGTPENHTTPQMESTGRMSLSCFYCKLIYNNLICKPSIGCSIPGTARYMWSNA